MAKHLLLKAIEHEREVDLSLFQSLSEEDLSVFISRLSKTVSLSLSGASISTGPLALNLSPANTSLGKLYFLDSPKLQLQQVLRLMHDPGMPWIYHADMFRRPLQYRLSLQADLQQNHRLPKHIVPDDGQAAQPSKQSKPKVPGCANILAKSRAQVWKRCLASR
jgi:hypothetical protein